MEGNLENEIDEKEDSERAENKNDNIENLVEILENDWGKTIDWINKISNENIILNEYGLNKSLEEQEEENKIMLQNMVEKLKIKKMLIEKNKDKKYKYLQLV